jgi:hypothetical protein
MRHICRLAALALALSTAARGLADSKPVAILALSSLNDVLADVTYITQAAGATQLGLLIKGMLEGYAQGLDASRPLGLVLYRDDQQAITPLALVPLADRSAFRQRLQTPSGAAEVDGQGVFRLAGPHGSLFVREVSDWAFLANSLAALERLPVSPSQEFQGLEREYHVALRVLVQNVPQTYVDRVRAQVRRRLDTGTGSDARSQLRAQLADQASGLVEAAFRGVDSVTLGWRTVNEERQSHLDVCIATLPRRDGAPKQPWDRPVFGDRFAQLNPAVSLHAAAYVPAPCVDSMLTLSGHCRRYVQEEVSAYDDLPNPAFKGIVQSLCDGLFDLFDATLREGVIDGETALLFDRGTGALTLVSGAHARGGKQLEERLRQMAAQSGGTVRLAVRQYPGVRIHTLCVPAPVDNRLRAILGKEVEVTFAVGEQQLFVAIGKEGLEQLIRSIDTGRTAAGNPAPCGHLVVALEPVLQIVNLFDHNPTVADAAEALAPVKGNDHVRLVIWKAGDDVHCRLTIEEGVLRALGRTTNNDLPGP